MCNILPGVSEPFSTMQIRVSLSKYLCASALSLTNTIFTCFSSSLTQSLYPLNLGMWTMIIQKSKMLIYTSKTASLHILDMQEIDTHFRPCLCPWHSYCCTVTIQADYVFICDPVSIEISMHCTLGHTSPFSQHDGCASYTRVIRVIIWWSTIHCRAYI